MRSNDDSLGLTAIMGPPAIAAVCIVVLHLLPSQVLTVLTAWVLLSYPIGVLIGHCALGED